MKRPNLDLADCVLCEICVEVCPQVFALNDLGYIDLLELSQYPEACVDDAIRNCPADCISWEGTDTDDPS